ncbi:MAG: fibrobacter succinogenes major paralogous domain-containing protein [Mariniphaga sp.]|nr:fibrobacter succinogenes major paralogous domain-containing protein [Mariniphaga sp.]
MKKLFYSILIIVSFMMFSSCHEEEDMFLNVEKEASLDSPILKSSSTINVHLLNMISLINTMIDQELIKKGNGKALIAKIRTILKNIEKENNNAVLNQLNALKNHVKALINSGAIILEQGQKLSELIESGENLLAGIFIDPRDNNKYSIVKIGEQIWMGENIRYNVDSDCRAYNNNEYLVNSFGRLYSWASAQNACPEGWHLPSDAEWTKLSDFLGGYLVAGGKLKTISGWYSNGNGTDDYGFSLLPGGFSFATHFNSFGQMANLWSSTTTEHNSNYAWYRYVNYRGSALVQRSILKNNRFSARCIKD